MLGPISPRLPKHYPALWALNGLRWPSLRDLLHTAAWKADSLKGGKMETQLVICQGCDLEFRVKTYEVLRGWGKFCSRQCQRAFQARVNAEAMKGELTQAEMTRRWRSEVSPLVLQAHHAVQQEIRIGRLTRQPCEVCGAERVDAHHDDYSKPLDVRWLCRGHHLKHHRARAS